MQFHQLADDRQPESGPALERVADESICVKRWNTLSWSSLAMPIPVSLTQISTGRSTVRASTLTLPFSCVYLIPFVIRFRRIWFSLPGSAHTSGRSVGRKVEMRMRLSWARGLTTGRTPRRAARRSTASRLSSRRPASILVGRGCR